jgi:hypothetical protein
MEGLNLFYKETEGGKEVYLVYDTKISGEVNIFP